MAARRFRDAARPARAHPRGHGDRRRDRHSVARGTARRRAVARDGRKGRARAAWRRPEIRVARRDFETRRSRRDKIAIVALAKARLARTGRIRTTRRGGEARGGSLGRGAGRRAAARKTATARGARSSWARSSARCRTRVTARFWPIRNGDASPVRGHRHGSSARREDPRRAFSFVGEAIWRARNCAGYGASWVLPIGAMGSRQVAPPMAQPVSSGYRQARSGRRREPRHGICAHRAPCATIGPRQRSIFSRAPFGFLSPAPASDGARERPRALHSRDFSRGSRVLPGPLSPCAAAAVRNNPSKPLSIQG